MECDNESHSRIPKRIKWETREEGRHSGHENSGAFVVERGYVTTYYLFYFDIKSDNSVGQQYELEKVCGVERGQATLWG